ncbi:hypothetical protein BH10CYA1_BH10CYA1_35050 [soil metagenome]
MQPFEFKATILSLSLFSAVTAAGAASSAGSVFTSSQQSGEKAYEQHQYKKAETSLLKALDAAATEGTKDVDVARARVLLAKVYRESARPQRASEQLVLALTIYKKLGFAEPVFADERTQLFKEYKQVDPGALGQGYDALKNNSAVISIQKKDAGAHVEFTMPAAMEKSLNSQKVDGLQLEAVVSFDLTTTSDGKVHASSIKGFKIHSVEKNTWANLLDLSVGGPANAEGTYDATIIAGKGGFTKTVAAKLPEKAYQPVKTIADQIEKFDGAPALDIPIAAAPAEVTPTATPSFTPSVTTVPVEAPTASTTSITPTTTTVAPDSTVSTAPAWGETKLKSTKPLSSPAVERPVMTTIEPTSTPISTSTPEVFSPKTETTTSTTTTVTSPTTTMSSPASTLPANVEQPKVKSKHDDDDDNDDKEDAARKQRRREEHRARRAAEDAKEAAEDAAEKLDDAKKHEKDNDKDNDRDKNDKDKKDKD